jgi:hypothetical protein
MVRDLYDPERECEASDNYIDERRDGVFVGWLTPPGVRRSEFKTSLECCRGRLALFSVAARARHIAR